ncbi:MAG: DUF5060 domain-containing protein [Candidatus Sumerlaeota bacterium]|nr:DUF5060 domain-containing protein [Candidatus Sumerlaeota bacterium]
MKPFNREMMRNAFISAVFALIAGVAAAQTSVSQIRQPTEQYFPPPETQGGWRALVKPNRAASAAEKKAVHEKAELDWDKLKAGQDYCAGFETPNSLLVIRHGWIAGEWNNYSNPRGVASCTKSVTALAMAKLFDLSDAGRLPKRISIEDEAWRFLPPEWSAPDPALKAIRIRHMMTMSSGLTPYDGPYKINYLQQVFGQKVEAPPGTVWAYASVPVDLLSLIIENVTSETEEAFFNREINAPIGAAPVKWGQFNGHSSGSGGLGGPFYLARDFARLGYMALHDGAWEKDGQRIQVISAERIKTFTRWAPFLEKTTWRQPNFAFEPHANQYYGHLWWTNRTGEGMGNAAPRDAFYMSGWGKQACFIVPSLDMVVVRIGADRKLNEHPEFYHELWNRLMPAVLPTSLSPASAISVAPEPSSSSLSSLPSLQSLPSLSESAPAVASQAAPRVIERWDISEFTFESSHDYSNPFRDVELTASFTHAATGRHLAVPGFYDGSQTWRVRFMPTETGEWSFATRSADPNLNNKTGQMECIAPAKPFLHGPLRAEGYHFIHADGTRRFLICTRLTCQFAEPATRQRTIRFLKEHAINRVLFIMGGAAGTVKDLFSPGPNFDRYNLEKFRAIDAFIDEMRREDVLAAPYFYYFNDRVQRSMTPEQDRAFLRYGMARFGAYCNVLPVLSNEVEQKFTDRKDPAYNPKSHEWANRMGAYLKQLSVFGAAVTVHNPMETDFATRPGFYTLLRDWPFPWADYMLRQAQVGSMGALPELSDSVPECKNPTYNDRAYARHNQLICDLRRFGIPIINEEPGYEMEGMSWDGKKRDPRPWNSQTPDTLLATFWTAVCGSGYVMWGNPSTYEPGDPLPRIEKSPTPRMLQTLAGVMSRAPYWEMTPANDVVTSAPRAFDGVDYRSNFALAKAGQVALVYSRHGGAMEVRVGVGQWRGVRINPRDGSETAIGEFIGPVAKMRCPDDIESIVILEILSRKFSEAF